MAIKSLAQTLKDLATGIKNAITGVTGSNATLTITKGDGTTSTINLIPAGTMQMFAGNTIPAGWLLCDGSAVSRTYYAKLFSAIGTTWGAGDGSTTFNLPNSIGRFAEGAATVGTYKAAGLPNIEGSFKMTRVNASIISTGAFSDIVNETNSDYKAGDKGITVSFNASKSNPIYGNSTTVQPPALTMLPIIKY